MGCYGLSSTVLGGQGGDRLSFYNAPYNAFFLETSKIFSGKEIQNGTQFKKYLPFFPKSF